MCSMERGCRLPENPEFCRHRVKIIPRTEGGKVADGCRFGGRCCFLRETVRTDKETGVLKTKAK